MRPSVAMANPKLPALPFVRSAVSEGLSANQAYSSYQTLAHDNGFQGMRRQTFLRLYSETTALRSTAIDAAGAPKNEPPPADQIIDRTTIRATGFGQWAFIARRQIGSSSPELVHYFMSGDKPLTPGQVEAQAQADFEASQQQEHGTARDYVLLGVGYLGTERLNPTQDA